MSAGLPQAISPTAAGAGTSWRPPFSFGRASRIRRSARFNEVFASSRKDVGRYLVAWCEAASSGEGPDSRLGVVASKKTFHDAVQRNRAKRLIRESFRKLRPSMTGPACDLVVVAKRRILEAGQGDVQADLLRRCETFGLVKGRGGSC